MGLRVACDARARRVAAILIATALTADSIVAISTTDQSLAALQLLALVCDKGIAARFSRASAAPTTLGGTRSVVDTATLLSRAFPVVDDGFARTSNADGVEAPERDEPFLAIDIRAALGFDAPAVAADLVGTAGVLARSIVAIAGKAFALAAAFGVVGELPADSLLANRPAARPERRNSAVGIDSA
jgi:hypothetical protein